jgi:hypothetical protein
MRLPHVRRPVGALERDGRLGQSLALPLPLCQGVSPHGWRRVRNPGPSDRNRAFAGMTEFSHPTGRGRLVGGSREASQAPMTRARRVSGRSSAPSVDVRAVSDRHHDHDPLLVVDSVDDSVGAAPR